MKILKISRPPAYIIGPLIFLIPIFLNDIAIDWLIILHSLILTFPLCFLLFGINDVYDIDTDLKNPRKKFSMGEGVILSNKEIPRILRIAAVCAVLLFVPAILRQNFLNMIATSLLVLFAYFYSAPPIRLKEKPPLDSFSNAMIVYLVFLMGLSYGPGLTGFPEQGYYLLFGIMGIHIFTTIMDYTPDIMTQTMTFATLFGKRLATLLSLLIFAFILIFSGIKSIFINLFIIYCIIISTITLIKPNEKLATWLFRIMFLVFLLLGISYAISVVL